MADTTHISWADHTHNHWLGCTKVSNGLLGACEGCYAKVLVEDRFGWAEFGAPGKGVGTRALTSEANRRKPLAWDRAAAKAGTRPFVFCSSLADVFDSDVPPEWRADLFDLIRSTPNLVWLLLTKRPGNIIKLFADTLPRTADKRDAALREAWPRNAAIGCTVVTQAEADRDVPKLLAAKAALQPAFAFLSMEPLMGPVDLRPWLRDLCPNCNHPECAPSLRSDSAEVFSRCGEFVMETPGPALDWIITGGETDQGSHKARPSHPEWFRAIRDQCAAAGVPYHHKQNGEWERHRPQAGGDLGGDVRRGRVQFVHRERHTDAELCAKATYPGDIYMAHVGKRHTGRALDGVIHDARPELA